MLKEDRVINRIKQSNSKRELLGVAYNQQGLMRSNQITPEFYAETMVLLAQKLGFGITDESLAEAAKEYI